MKTHLINRFYILFLLALQLLPATGICGLLFFLLPKLKKPGFNKMFWFYVLTGLSASVPIMASLKQQTFYLIPAMPFFALAAATFAEHYIDELEKKLANLELQPALNILFLVIIIATIGFSITRIGKPGRDITTITELDEISYHLPKNQIVSIPNNMFTDWTLQAYLYRFYHISADASGQEHTYYLTNETDRNKIPAGYVPVTGPLPLLQLYKKR